MRQTLLTEVLYEGRAPNSQTRISDISRGGVFIDTMQPLPVGTNLKFSFNVSGGRVVSTEGVVVHAHAAIGMGVEFTSIGPEEQALIDRVVSG